MAKSRKEKRDEAAEKVCRELRWQLSVFGCVTDYDSLMKQFRPWLKNAKINKYDRP